MKDLYNQLLTLLNDIPTLKWKDLNVNQLQEEQPAVLFPCALIDINLPICNDIDTGAKMQQHTSRFTITLAIKAIGESNANATVPQRANALAYFDLVQDVFKKLQGFGSEVYYPFTTKSIINIGARKGLKVVALTFETSWHDYTANS